MLSFVIPKSYNVISQMDSVFLNFTLRREKLIRIAHIIKVYFLITQQLWNQRTYECAN